MSANTALTQGTTFVIAWPADLTASNNRLVRRVWQGSLAPRAVMGQPDNVQKAAVVQWCIHSHKSPAAAIECATAMWKRLAR